jgi:hypothetical protein
LNAIEGFETTSIANPQMAQLPLIFDQQFSHTAMKSG